MNKTMTRYGTILRIYDNGGKTFDRYTILPPRHATQYRSRAGWWQAIGASDYPYSPQGFGQTCTAQAGPHLGKRITWTALPVDVQVVARDVFPEYCPAAHWYTSGSGKIELQLTIEQAQQGGHSGQCDADIAALLTMPSIATQFAKIDPRDISDELRGYGAWSDEELTDHAQNMARLLWVACGKIAEGK